MTVFVLVLAVLAPHSDSLFGDWSTRRVLISALSTLHALSVGVIAIKYRNVISAHNNSLLVPPDTRVKAFTSAISTPFQQHSFDSSHPLPSSPSMSGSVAAVHRVHELEKMIRALREELTQSQYQLSRFLPPPPSHPSTDNAAYSGVNNRAVQFRGSAAIRKDQVRQNLGPVFAADSSSDFQESDKTSNSQQNNIQAIQDELQRVQDELQRMGAESAHWQQAENVARHHLEEAHAQLDAQQLKVRALIEENTRLTLLVDVQNDAHTNMQQMLESAMQ